MTSCSFQVADGISVPASVALPFGAFERTLKDPANAAYADAIEGLIKDLVRTFLLPLIFVTFTIPALSQSQ